MYHNVLMRNGNIKGATKPSRKIFFVCATKIGENITNILNCYFQAKFTPWSIKLNTYMYEIKFTSHKQYLFAPLLSIKAKKTRTNQNTLQFFLLRPNWNHSQTFKSSCCKKFFLQCVCYRCNLLQWTFFISCDNWKTLFFSKSLQLLWDFFNRHIVVSFETKVLKEVRILRYLHNSSAALIPKLQSKALVRYTFLSLYIRSVFLKNSKPLWKHVFTQ